MRRTPIAVNIEIDYKPEVAEKLSRLYDILLADQSAYIQESRNEGDTPEEKALDQGVEGYKEDIETPVYTSEGLDNI